MSTPTIDTPDIPVDETLTVDEAADAIFARQVVQPDDGDVDGDDGNHEEADAADADPPDVVEAADDAIVRIGGQAVTVGDLKRLAGQEAELTQATAAAAQRRQEADQRFEANAAALARLIERAQGAYKPFEAIDWVIAQKELTADELRALRTEAKEREDTLKLLTGEAEQIGRAAMQQRHEALTRAAEDAHRVLPDMLKAAGGAWDQKTHGAIADYAVKTGFPAEAVSAWVDPNIIATVYKAMRYDAIRATASKKTTPAVAPARPAATGSARDAAGERPAGTRAAEALARLRQTGSVEDAADAIFARMTARR